MLPTRRPQLERGYARMAGDKEREKEAAQWIEALIGDIFDEMPQSATLEFRTFTGGT